MQRTTITIADADEGASSIRSPKDGEGIDAVEKDDYKIAVYHRQGTSIAAAESER